MGLYDFTFYDLINRNASTYGNKTAWVEVDDDRRLTFTAYKEKADRLACGLQKSGVQKGDRIGVVGKTVSNFSPLRRGRSPRRHRITHQLAALCRGDGL